MAGWAFAKAKIGCKICNWLTVPLPDYHTFSIPVCEPKFFGPKIFQGTKFVFKQFSGLKKLCKPKHFQIQFFLDPKALFHTQKFFQKNMLDPKIFQKLFSDQKIYFCPKILDPKAFVDPKFLRTHKSFQTKIFFGPNICLGLEDFH